MVSQCENFTEDGGYSYQLTRWWSDTFIQDVVTSIGIIGNILICVILVQKNVRRNTFNQLRVALALFDTILLITMFCLFVLLRSSKDILQAVQPVLLWPFMSISMTISDFMTVVIAWERYGAINNPYAYKSYLEYRAMKYVSSLIVAAFILNIGKFFEFQPTQCVERLGFSGVLKLGPILKNHIYSIYNMVIFKVLIGGIIPVALLTCLYTKIFLKIQKHKLTMASQSARVKKKMMKEQRMAITFAGVVITHLVCIIPGWIISFKILIDGGEAKDLEFYETICIVRMVFYAFNSGTNIFIYICLDKTFRGEFKKFFKCLIIQSLSDIATTSGPEQDSHNIQ